MARAKLKGHTLAIGAKKYNITLADVYSGADSGSDIGPIVGITVGVADNPDGGETLSTAMRTGRLGKIRISYRVSANVVKSAVIACAIDKMDSAPHSLADKKYRTYTIVSAGIPRRRRLG